MRKLSLQGTSLSGAECGGQCGCVHSRSWARQQAGCAPWRRDGSALTSLMLGAQDPGHFNSILWPEMNAHRLQWTDLETSPQGPLVSLWSPSCGLPSPTRVRAWERRTFKGSIGLTAPDSKARMEVFILGRKIYSGHLLNRTSETKKSS